MIDGSTAKNQWREIEKLQKPCFHLNLAIKNICNTEFNLTIHKCDERVLDPQSDFLTSVVSEETKVSDPNFRGET
jgi:hypothetical protein